MPKFIEKNTNLNFLFNIIFTSDFRLRGQMRIIILYIYESFTRRDLIDTIIHLNGLG